MLRKIELINYENMPRSSSNVDEIYRFLIATKGEFILTGRERRTLAFQGPGIEWVMEVGLKMGLKVKIVKEFPDTNPVLYLVKIEE